MSKPCPACNRDIIEHTREEFEQCREITEPLIGPAGLRAPAADSLTLADLDRHTGPVSLSASTMPRGVFCWKFTQ